MPSELRKAFRQKTISCVCQVCGSNEASTHYDVVCCFPCKMFFRRNAHLDMSSSKCESNGLCSINACNRKGCRFCRMKKCLAVGMKKELFRPFRSTCQVQRQPLNDSVQLRDRVFFSMTIQPLDLLYHDRSLLSIEQWSLLSNVIHCYDSHSPIPEIQYGMITYEATPPKHRLKVASNNLMVTMHLFFSSVWSFVKSVPHFNALSLMNRLNLIQRNVHHMGALSGAHICQEGKFHDDPTNQCVAIAAYGELQMVHMLKAIEMGIADRVVSKLFLLIMSFSTASDVVRPTGSYNNQWKDINLSSNTTEIFKVQNIFVEILFKFMIYRFGYIPASIYYAQMITNALIQGAFLQEVETNPDHDFMVQNIIQGFEQSLILNQNSIDILS